MRRMEQYFLVRWTTQSQVIRFQVSRENTRSNGLLFYLSLLALGLLNDSEGEKNDVCRWGWQYHFYCKESTITFTVPLYFPDEFKSHFRMTSELFTRVYSSAYAHISRSSVFSHYSLKLVRLIHCNNVAVRYFNRLSDRGLVFCLEAWGQPCWFPGSEKLGMSRNGRMERNFPVIPILRNFRPTSRGTPKISEWNSGKCLFHSLPNPEFPEFLVKWKAPHVYLQGIFLHSFGGSFNERLWLNLFWAFFMLCFFHRTQKNP